jgi:hypothetical protein
MSLGAVRDGLGAAPRVLLRGHGLQVVGVNARSVPAEVVEDQSVRDGSHVHLEGKPVGIVLLAVDVQAAIAVVVLAARPNDAGIWASGDVAEELVLGVDGCPPHLSAD